MPIPQNGQTHSNNSSAFDRFVKLALKGLTTTYQAEQPLQGIAQPTITCSNLTKETLEQGVKYVKS